MLILLIANRVARRVYLGRRRFASGQMGEGTKFCHKYFGAQIQEKREDFSSLLLVQISPYSVIANTVCELVRGHCTSPHRCLYYSTRFVICQCFCKKVMYRTFGSQHGHLAVRQNAWHIVRCVHGYNIVGTPNCYHH